MVGAGKGALAQSALERPVARVFAVVAGQLVGAGEFPSAAFPRALVRFLARVRPKMGLEVRRFRVRLGASGMRASVNNNPPLAPSPSAARADGSGGRCDGRSCDDIAADRQMRRRRRSQGRKSGDLLRLGRVSLLLLLLVIVRMLELFPSLLLLLLLLDESSHRCRRSLCLLVTVDAVWSRRRWHLTLVLLLLMVVSLVVVAVLLDSVVSGLRVVGVVIMLLRRCRNGAGAVMMADDAVRHPLRRM